MPARIHELPELRNRTQVFRDRAAAGGTLAAMLEPFCGTGAIVLAVPAGGVPVAAEIARLLGLALDIAVVSKILFPWTTEAGFGAVAFDGSVWTDEEAVAHLGLSPEDVKRSTGQAAAKVQRRVRRLRGGRPLPDLTGRTVILVDDGIAAGSTLRTAITALRKQAAAVIVVAVPTGHERSVELIADLADAVYCANVRGGGQFAVADAYEDWRDVTEDEMAAILKAAVPRGSR